MFIYSEYLFLLLYENRLKAISKGPFCLFLPSMPLP